MNRFIYLQIFVFAIIVAFMGNFNAYAQDASAGPVPKAKQFSDKTVFNNNQPLSLIPGDTGYGWESISGSTISMPIPAGTPFTNLAPFAPISFAASGVVGGDGNYYFVDVAPALYYFDPLTGSVNTVGPITGMGADTPNGISYNPVNGNYYMVSSNNLFQLNIVTLVASLIGPLNNGAGVMIDLSINSAGVCYAYDLVNDDAGTINLATGNYTPLGPIGFDANFGQGMDIDQVTGDIYLSAFNGTTTTGQLRQMNPTTGATVLLFDWGFAQVAPFAINNAYAPLPGPGYATNPTPVWNATNVLLDDDLSWTNSAATSIELFFGTDPASLTSVYSGAPITTFDQGTMAYSTTYYWRVNQTDGSGTTTGYLWSFTTEAFVPPAVPLPIVEDFDSGVFPPFGWTQNGVIWRGDLDNGPPNNVSAVADFYSTPSGFDDLVTIEYFSTGAPNPLLTFDWAYAVYPGAVDHLEIYTSTDQGTSWVLLVDMYDGAPGDDNLNPFGLSTTSPYFPQATEWSTRSIILPPNTTNVSFTAVTDYGNLLWVDNVQITSELFEDFFDTYTAGLTLTTQTSDWETWSSPSAPGEDPLVSNAQSYSTPNSVLVVQGNDFVRQHGPKTSGKWYMQFLFYIPAGNSGYFNTMNQFVRPATFQWGMDAFFDVGGTGLVDTLGDGGAPASSVPFTWTEDAWNQTMVVVDLDNSMAEFWVGQVPTMTKIAEWDWTHGGVDLNELAVNDFYGGAATDNMYIDNYYFSDKAPPIIQLTDDVGPISIDVDPQVGPGTFAPLATVTNYGTGDQSFDVQMTINPGGYTSTKTTGLLSQGDIEQLTFDNYTAVTGGPFTVEVTTLLVSDQNTANDVISQGLYVWDPSGTWSSGTVMPAGTYLGGGASYVEVTEDANIGHLYSIGGVTASGLGTECYEYNVVSDAWTAITSLPAGRDRNTAAIVGGFVYSIAGYDAVSGVQVTDVNKYDISLGGAWVPVAPLPAAIGWGKAVGYDGNYIYHAGGFDGTDYRDDVYLYDVVANTWVSATSMPGPAFGGGFAINGDKLVYIGGASPSGINDAVYVGTITANPAVINWTTATSKFPGLGIDRTVISSDVFDNPDSRFWDNKNHLLENVPLPSGGLYRTDAAAWGTDGVIITTGTQSAFDPQLPNPCYVYNISSDTWTAQENLPIPVLGSALGSVNDGSTWKLIVAGGSTSSGVSITNTQIFTNTLGGTTFPLALNIIDGWNMVSVPGNNPSGMGVSTWWPGLTGSVFGYSGGYTIVTTTNPGEGYWMKHVGPTIYNYPALQIVPHTDVPLVTGWNLIGLYENSELTATLTTSPPGIITGSIFRFNGSYVVATQIDPGYAYWVKTTGPGVITNLTPPPSGKEGTVVELFKEDWGKITITDATGKSFTLYAIDGEVNLENYEMPPMAPADVFDVRYESNRIAEDLNSEFKAIQMTAIEYPITVMVENMDIRLQDETGKLVDAKLKSGEDITISKQLSKLMVTGEVIPDVFALEQNYPNPFNPSTVIEFSLAENVKNAKLTIYNTLGEKVAELVNTSLEAGRYSYQWDASNVATGMYIYELRADKFVSIKKMLLLK